MDARLTTTRRGELSAMCSILSSTNGTTITVQKTTVAIATASAVRIVRRKLRRARFRTASGSSDVSIARQRRSGRCAEPTSYHYQVGVAVGVGVSVGVLVGVLLDVAVAV